MTPRATATTRRARRVVCRLWLVGGTVALVFCHQRSSEPSPPRRVVILAPLLPDQLDPDGDFRLISRTVYVNVFDPLVRVGPVGEFLPALAESWTTPSADVWSFQLRAAVRFHDGTPVRPGDVVASLERSRGPGSRVAGNLSDVKSISAPSVTFKTRGASGNLLQALTGVLVSKVDQAGRFLGTGPYRVESFEPGRRIRLRRFEGYYGPPPSLDEVVFERFSGEREGAALLAKERFAIALDPTPGMVALARADRRLVVRAELSGSLRYLAFNLSGSVPAFRDARVRRAAQLALDVEGLAAVEAGIPASQVVPPGIFGFDSGRKVVARDLAGARALLAQAGYAQGVDFQLDVSAEDRVAARVAEQLGEAGLRARVQVWPSGEFNKVIEGRTDAYLYSWFVGQEAGEAVKNFFHTRSEAAGVGLRNRTGYSSRSLDQVIESALRTDDAESRLALFKKAIGILAEDVPWVPLYAGRSLVLHPRGWRVPPRTDGILVLAEIEPSPEAPDSSAPSGILRRP